ncbi:hypothetical protein EDC01DRAFT_723447 [Geopyxis carbonaria]|nr:hypothetical protein EDC01DRAFT_723447 [Geopyxis carbonaria]
MAYHNNDYYGGYAPPVPPPPPPPNEFQYAPAPQSSFGPPIDYAHPQSPLVVNASPAPSVVPSRASSRPRGMSHGHSEYMVAGGLHRSQSDRGRILVEDRGRRNKTYHEDDYSAYKSREHSRPPRSRSRRRRDHSRTPSWASGASGESYDDRESRDSRGGGLVKYNNNNNNNNNNKPSRQEEELNKKLKLVQEQLEKVQVDAERKRLEEQQKAVEAQRNAEIERKVQEQLKLAEHQKIEKERKDREALEAERARIATAARKLLEEQAAAAAAAAAAKKAEEDKIAAIIEGERRKYASAQQGKTTYTRFSKVHLCKEALEERKIPFSEEAENFLVHRFVEKTEQDYLWSRTKEIRAYYKQIQQAAESAPAVPGPNGGYVKYVQIAGQPYPIALPVTLTPSPGGGQTQRVDTQKVKWRELLLKR